MRVLISAVGTRGDVEPALALAAQVRALGSEVRMCVPPNFTGWAQALGFEARPIGVAMRAPRKGEPPPVVPDLVADQFVVVGAAAEGCGLIVGAGAHQYAARSIAEARGLGYALAVYAPVALPTPEFPPSGAPREPADANLAAWDRYRLGWNDRSLARVNANRATLGRGPLDDSYGHILGETPWLACDAVLGPAPETPGRKIVQTGAWRLADESPLPAEVERFLQAGEAPVYIGFGSMPAAEDLGRIGVEAARAVGRRVILSRGWAELAAIDDAADCLAIDDMNHGALFPRVAAVAHHGGAGTTTAAALAGVPQAVTPMFGDQVYWGRRIVELGLGASTPAAGLTAERLAGVLADALGPEAAARAKAVATRVTPDGAAVAARQLLETFG